MKPTSSTPLLPTRAPCQAFVAGNYGTFKARPALPALTRPAPCARATDLRGGGAAAQPTARAHAALAAVIHADAATQDLAATLIRSEALDREIAPYAYTTEQMDLLADFGIGVPANGTESHSHPLHATIERYMLRRVLRGHITGDYTAFWIKDHKARQLPGCVASHNISVDIRDLGRYGHLDWSAKFPATINTATIFLADVGQHMDRSLIPALFRQYPNLQQVVFTGVMPFEALLGQPSFCPALYTWLPIPGDPDSYAYFLEGNDDEHYVQPRHSLELLRANAIGPHGLERLQSIGAHHLWKCTRGLPPLPKRHDFMRVPGAVILPQAFNTDLPDRDRALPRKEFYAAWHHSRHLKKFQVNDAEAKLRTLRKESHRWVTEAAWRYAAKYLEATRENYRSQEIDLRPSSPAMRAIRAALAKISAYIEDNRIELAILAAASLLTSSYWLWAFHGPAYAFWLAGRDLLHAGPLIGLIGAEVTSVALSLITWLSENPAAAYKRREITMRVQEYYVHLPLTAIPIIHQAGAFKFFPPPIRGLAPPLGPVGPPPSPGGPPSGGPPPKPPAEPRRTPADDVRLEAKKAELRLKLATWRQRHGCPAPARLHA